MMEYRIIRSRRKTLAIEITSRREILVRAPSRISKRDIQRFVESKQDWIMTHLSKVPVVTPLTPNEHKALILAAKETLPSRTAFYAKQLGVTFGRITIRSQKSRWGSCSVSGNLNFNCLLMLAPEAVQNYVVVHELCHRKHMDHSKDFYAEVERVLPEYKKCQKWLKEHGGVYLRRVP